MTVRATVSTVRHLKPPDPAIVDASIRDQDITDPDDIELGTVANGGGLCRTVSANRIGDISPEGVNIRTAAPKSRDHLSVAPQSARSPAAPKMINTARLGVARSIMGRPSEDLR